MKVCSICKEEKPFEMFDKRNDPKKSKDGYDYLCKECKRKKARVSYLKNKEKHLERRRKKYKEDPSFHMYHEAKKRAKTKGIPFDLDKDDIKVPEKCPVLGIPLIVGEGKTTDNSPSLDKYVPSLGYVKGNINVISNKANAMKSNASKEEVLALYNWMVSKETNIK